MKTILVLLCMLVISGVYVYLEQKYYYNKYKLPGESYDDFCKRYYNSFK